MSLDYWCAIHHWRKRRGNKGGRDRSSGRIGAEEIQGWVGLGGGGGLDGRATRERGGHSLGDTLIGMVILIFIPLVFP